jgi:hypothetical protein
MRLKASSEIVSAVMPTTVPTARDGATHRLLGTGRCTRVAG